VSAAAGIDVGSSSVKVAVVEADGGGKPRVVSAVASKIRKREIAVVVRETFDAAVGEAGCRELAYVATTGDGEDVPFATGHFYGMTTHARGALFLAPEARAVLDGGALHTRAVAMDSGGRVLGYKMTSQCASGSGQFLENIARYLGVSQAEIGPLSIRGDAPETVSSICAVLAETDVINMVSRGVSPPNILRGIHQSMAGRFVRLLVAIGATGAIFVSGGLAADDGLIAALEAAASGPQPAAPRFLRHPRSIHSGAIGAALWGHYRCRKIGLEEAAWTSH